MLAVAFAAGCSGHNSAASRPSAQVPERSPGSILAGSGELAGEAPSPDLAPLSPRAFRTPVARYRVYAGAPSR